MPPDFTTPGQIHFKISKEQILSIKDWEKNLKNVPNFFHQKVSNRSVC